MDDFNYYQLTGDGFDFLRAYNKRLEKFKADRAVLQKEFEKRVQELDAEAEVELKGFWIRMAASVNVDGETSWNNKEWYIETRFVDSGFGALINIPTKPNPLLEALGVEEPEKEEESSVPEGVTLQ